MSSNDSELILSYLNILQRGDNLGFGWSRKLTFLLENNAITEEQFEEYTIIHQNIKKGVKDKIKERVKCQACGDVINAGTYGIIFNSNNNENNVIKGSIKGHSVTTGCPKDYEHEIIMYSKIYPVFKSLKLDNIRILEVHNKWIENRRCYYEMDKIYPFVVTEELKSRIDSYIVTNPKYQIPLNDLKSGNNLFMLKPGHKNKDHYFSDNINFSNWKEIGENLLNVYFRLLNYPIISYYLSLFFILDSTIKNNILLFDVEFILGSVKNGDVYENGIFMIDFDKTQSKVIDFSDVELLLNQDAFSDYSKYLFSENNLKLKKKYMKYKKKYLELKNNIKN